MIARKVKCPTCKKETEYSEKNAHRPFCSERCQLIDFGEWAEGRYSIPDEENKPSSSELQEKGTKEEH